MSSSYSYVGEALNYRWELIGEEIDRNDLKTDINNNTSKYIIELN